MQDCDGQYQTGANHNARTPRNRLSSPAANNWQCKGGTADTSSNPRKQINVVGWCQIRQISASGKNLSALYRLESRGHPCPDCGGVMMPTNKNARRQPGIVKLFSPVGTGCAKYNASCLQCGATSRGKPLCYTCWRWTLSAQHTRAAAALLRGLR